MARIRTIKPEFWTNERVMECSLIARLLFIGMWNFADDLGRLPLAPKTIKAQIFPSDEMSSEIIRGMIEELSKNGLILTYEVQDREYIQIVGWQHQRIDKPQPGKCPGPINGYSKIVPGTVETEWKGRDSKGEEGNSEPIGSGAASAPNPRDRLFDEGLKKLEDLTGKGPDSCRSFIGKCLKSAADDASVVLGAIDDAHRNRVADAPAWISARLKTTPPSSATQADMDWDAVLSMYKKTGHWSRFAGPDPDSPACRAPPALLTKYGIRTMRTVEEPAA
jgi:hypothetical protein